MPQMFIPIFSEGLVHINSHLAYEKQDGRIYYFNGHLMPVFSHAENDIDSFRMIMSQFYVNGNATQAEIIRTFGLPNINLKRAVKQFREKGPSSFYVSTPKVKNKPRVLTEQVLLSVQKSLDEGKTVQDISKEFNLKEDTVRVAIRDGRLKKKPCNSEFSYN